MMGYNFNSISGGYPTLKLGDVDRSRIRSAVIMSMSTSIGIPASIPVLVHVESGDSLSE